MDKMKKHLNVHLSILVFSVYFLIGSAAFAQSYPDCQVLQFGIITVNPNFELNGAGNNIDSIEFWKAPDSTETLMFVTAKGNSSVEVWKYPFEGNEQTPREGRPVVSARYR